MKAPVLQTERLQLRLIQQGDAAFILKGLSDKKVTQYYSVHYNTLEEVQEQMAFYENLLKDGTGIWWAYALKGDSTLIGACGLSRLEQEHQKAALGFWLLPDYWGNGYAPEAARAVLKYSFDHLHLNRIEAFVEGGNIASEQVLQKLNFKNEGTLRERESKNGEFIDLIYYSLLRKDVALPGEKSAKSVR